MADGEQELTVVQPTENLKDKFTPGQKLAYAYRREHPLTLRDSDDRRWGPNGERITPLFIELSVPETRDQLPRLSKEDYMRQRSVGQGPGGSRTPKYNSDFVSRGRFDSLPELLLEKGAVVEVIDVDGAKNVFSFVYRSGPAHLFPGGDRSTTSSVNAGDISKIDGLPKDDYFQSHPFQHAINEFAGDMFDRVVPPPPSRWDFLKKLGRQK
jgi:hypothetical protein